MRISIIGSGYVGLVSGTCFAELGHDVVCVDIVQEKVDSINSGRSPIFEEGLDDLLSSNLSNGRFRATTDIDAIVDTDLTFICVGTPSNEDGSWNLDHVRSATASIGERLSQKEGYHTVVLKSTVVPTTCEEVVLPILEESSGKKMGRDLGLAVNPEFLKEGVAVKDFMSPDRIVIGGIDERSISRVRELYSGFTCPFVEVPLSTAEMIKVASNSFLATKISFVNEIGNVCKDMGIDFRDVAKGMGLDPRIGNKFLRAGAGFGGSCFPKDVAGIVHEAKRRGIEPLVLQATLEVNERQPLRMVELLERHMDVGGRSVAVLGLAFKPGTDDIREARSIVIVEELLRKGAIVRAHDFQAEGNFRRIFPDITYCHTPEECVEGSDAVLIVTEWPEYSAPSLYGDRLVVDGRGAVKTNNYEGICW